MGLELGRLQRVELRDAWKTEAGDFTPWLAEEENLQLLAETLGVELELEAQEQAVGPFRADIVCRDTLSDDYVLIENQIERTDHTHLGQLMTYAAGLKAVTIIWISAQFTEEHRAAVDWLNEITDERFAFFGLEVELWQIGESAVAPKFNIVCKPNDWSKSVRSAAAEAGSLSESKMLQLEFWGEFKKHLECEGSKFAVRQPRPSSAVSMTTGKSGVRLTAVASLYSTSTGSFSDHEIRAQITLGTSGTERYYAKLEAQRGEIEREMGESLTWYNREGVKRSRVFVLRQVDLEDKEQWPEYFAWLADRLDRLYGIVSARL